MKNFRDIGYSNVGKGVLFRGTELSELSNEDRELLFQDHDIKTVVDLRSPQEVEKKKDVEVESARNINIPLLTIEEMSVAVQGQFPDVVASYRAAVGENKQDVWAKIFEVLLNNSSGGILFHCTQGKDRTGIVVAVLLRALGVDEETVYKDYLLTNEFASMPEQYRQYAQAMPEDIRKLFYGLFYVDKDFLAESFKEIDRLYGSLEGFFVACCGLDQEKRERLKEKYLIH